MAGHTIAVMQPTYLPWVGYFDLIDQVDEFVLLDDVEFSKQSWQQRNRIKTANGVQWLTVPVLTKGKLGQTIAETRISTVSKGVDKHASSISQSYSRASCFSEYGDEFGATLRETREHLVDLNVDLISWFCTQFGITTRMTKSSSLSVGGKKVERLLNICEALGARCYVSPPGSKVYIDENNLFEPNQIRLVYQNYQHPSYAQLYGDFVSHLSAVDLLFNEGGKSLEIIRSGRLPGIGATGPTGS